MEASLEKLKFFNSLEKAERDAILRATSIINFQPRDVIFNQGEPANTMYYIKQGLVQISVRLPADEEITATVLEAGCLFGELSFLDNLPRSATAKAIDEVTVYTIPYDALDLFKTYFHPGSFSFMHHFSDILCQRICRINQQIDTALAQELNPSQHIRPKKSIIYFNDPSLAPCKLNIPLKILRQLPLFKTLTQTECEIFLKYFTCWKLPRGCCVFSHNETSTSGFVVLRGAVQVIAQREEKALRLAVYGPGKIFGEVAMILGSQRLVSAYVRENAILLEIRHDQYQELINTKSILAFKFINHVAESLVELLRIHDRQLARFAAENVIVK